MKSGAIGCILFCLGARLLGGAAQFGKKSHGGTLSVSALSRGVEWKKGFGVPSLVRTFNGCDLVRHCVSDGWK